MIGWRIRPGEYVLQVIFEDASGDVTVYATDNDGRRARRLMRRLERRYGNAPPPLPKAIKIKRTILR